MGSYHHFLRSQPNQADIQVNLLSRHDRKAQSHEIARRLRPELDKIGVPFGARIKVAEVPPGPPVLQTLVAEVYGPDYKGQIELAAQIKKVFHQTPRVVDVDWYVEDLETKYDVKVDLEKAALPHPYIEWYSDANCRVVLELDPPQVGIVKSDSLRKEKMADWRLHLPAQRTES